MQYSICYDTPGDLHSNPGQLCVISLSIVHLSLPVNDVMARSSSMLINTTECTESLPYKNIEAMMQV